jgi:nucleoside 2-deoxyribosyltransferase
MPEVRVLYRPQMKQQSKVKKFVEFLGLERVLYIFENFFNLKKYKTRTEAVGFESSIAHMKIYFAGSIRGGRDDKDLYLSIIKHLQNHGQVLTEHIGDASLSSMGETTITDEYIYERDMNWIKEADIVVAEVTQTSLGVGYEIGWADGKKPIVCLYREQEEKRLSAMLTGNKNLTVFNYKDLDDAKNILDDYFKK